MADRRSHPRHRTLKAGKIVFDHHCCVVDCTIRNMSAAGACLQVASTLGIPDRFDLLVGPEKAARPCRVAWKDENHVGIMFQ